MKIRKAKTKDLNEFLEMKKGSIKSFLEISGEIIVFTKKKYTLEFEGYHKSRNNSIHILESKDKETIGYMQTTFKKNKLANFGYLNDLFIKKEFRGKGYGKCATKEFIKIAKVKGVEKIGLGTRVENKPAIKLYEKLGFEKIGYNFGMKLKK